MTHWRTSGLRSGGFGLEGRSPSALDTQRYSIPPLPAGSILERGKFTQAMIDGLAVTVTILFGCVAGAAFGVAVFILLFVHT